MSEETRTLRKSVNAILLVHQQIVVDSTGQRNWSSVGEDTVIIDEKEYKLVEA